MVVSADERVLFINPTFYLSRVFHLCGTESHSHPLDLSTNLNNSSGNGRLVRQAVVLGAGPEGPGTDTGKQECDPSGLNKDRRAFPDVDTRGDESAHDSRTYEWTRLRARRLRVSHPTDRLVFRTRQTSVYRHPVVGPNLTLVNQLERLGVREVDILPCSYDGWCTPMPLSR